MSIKENLKAVKKELNTEEQFIENFIKGERFIKKYKYYILILALVLLAWLGGNFIYTKIQENNAYQSNQLYLKLLKEPNNENLLTQLQNKNANLYIIFLLEQFHQSQDTQILEKIQAAIQDKNINSTLKNVTFLNLNEKSIFLKNYDKLMQAYQLLEKNQIEEAHILLNQIKNDSSLKQISENLKHYQGTLQ